MICAASDQCHSAGVCDPTTGACSNPARPDGARCDDGNKCTTSDACRAGACVGKDPIVCTAGDQCHIAGTCDPTTGLCSNPAKPDNAPCDDGDKCTQVDACQYGICVGAVPVSCTASDQCHDSRCDQSTGGCSNSTKENGSPCNDGNQCTEADSCQTGVCRGKSICVLTYHNDDASTGLYANENVLTPTNVRASTFGKLYSVPVDGQVYAQPLYVASVKITRGASQGVHDVVYVATQHDSLYAIDAGNGSVLWHVSFLDPDRGITAVPATDLYGPAGSNIAPEVGITATPVIDPLNNTLYVTAKTKEVADGDAANPHYVYSLHAVDLGSGAHTSIVIGDTTCVGGPIPDVNPANPTKCASYTYNSGPYSLGTGDGSIDHDGEPRVYFNAVRELLRAGLVLFNGLIFVAAAGHADGPPWHGWLLAYDQSLSLAGVFNVTPNTWGGAIWHGGGKLAVDADGFMYGITGNGSADVAFDADGFPASGDYPNTFLKLALDAMSTPARQNTNGWGFKVVDFFTPFNRDALDLDDFDLGSGGPLIVPNGVGSEAHPNLLVGAGKEGRIYLLDRDNLGRFTPNGPDAVVQQLVGDGPSVSAVWDTPSYFDDGITKRIYLVPTGFSTGVAAAYTLSDGILSSSPTSQSPDTFSYAGPTVSLSCTSSNSNGILWALARGANELRAYDPADLGHELYTSGDAEAGRDRLGAVVKFTVPTVARGRVFVGTSDALVAFGLLQGP